MSIQGRSRSIVRLFLSALIVFLAVSPFCFSQEEPAATPSAADQLRIGSMEVLGNVSIAGTKILSVVRARVGEIFDSASAAEDARRIGQIDGVKLAYYNTKIVEGKIRLSFVVVEKNLIRSIIFKGNSHFSSSKLTKEVGIRKGDYLDEFLVKNGIDLIKDRYRKAGYGFVEIILHEAPLAQGRVVYNITEGPRIKVKKIVFEGNRSIESKKLKRAIKTSTRKFFFWPAYYDVEKIGGDVSKLAGIFQKRGFLDAKIKVEEKFSEDRKSAFVTFVIEEGSMYTVEAIVFSGNDFFDNEQLQQGFKLKADEFYSREKADFDIKSIARLYRQVGFIDAQIDFKRSFVADGRVAAEFDIIEGSRFKIGKVAITGNASTHDKVVRRILDESDFKPGQWYNADIARGDGTGELEKTVRRQVLTESAFIKPVGDMPSHRDGHVNIIEGQTGSIMLGAGVASDSGLIGMMTFDQRNFDIKDWPESFQELFTGQAFKGAGQRLRISAEPGTDQSRFLVSFTEPYLYDKPVSLDVIASSFERFQESYDEERLKGYLGFEKRYRNKWRRGISFRLENVEITDIDSDAPKEIKDVKGNNDLFGVKLYIRKDTTDSRFLPSRGYNFNAGYEQVGGDYTFGILSGTQRWYRTLYEDLAERKTILETKIHAATIVGDAPAFEKFYAGGTSSIRGFDFRGVSTRGLSTNTVGPKERKDPIGSDWLLLANAEVQVPITSEVFSMLFFTDAGLIDTGGARASVGVGLQILIPQWFGPVPMRFELAAPLLEESGDEKRVFSFSVGALF